MDCTNQSREGTSGASSLEVVFMRYEKRIRDFLRDADVATVGSVRVN